MLSITSTPAKIGIQTTHARLDTSTSGGELNISTKKPEIRITGSFPNIEIEKSQTDYEYGLRTPFEMLKERAEIGKQSAYEAIGRIARDGDRLKDIRNKMPAAIPELAMKNSQPKPVSINIGMIGISRPKVEVVGGHQIDFEPGSVNTEYTPRKVEGNYTPGKVDVYMQQYPDINISYNIDTSA